MSAAGNAAGPDATVTAAAIQTGLTPKSDPAKNPARVAASTASARRGRCGAADTAWRPGEWPSSAVKHRFRTTHSTPTAASVGASISAAKPVNQVAGSLKDPSVLAAIQAARTPSAGAWGPFASPADWRDGWISFLMVDRFNNPGVNNPGAPPAHGSHTDLDGVGMGVDLVGGPGPAAVQPAARRPVPATHRGTRGPGRCSATPRAFCSLFSTSGRSAP